MIVLTKLICIIMKAFNLLEAVYDSPEDKTALATFFLLHVLVDDLMVLSWILFLELSLYHLTEWTPPQVWMLMLQFKVDLSPVLTVTS